MQTLSGTLQAAQQRMDVQPALSVLVSDIPPEAPRLAELASQYTGTNGDHVFDACFTNTGRIARCYWDGAGNVYAQVVNPLSSPAWDTWTLVDNAASAFANTAPVAIAGSQDGSGSVYLYWVDSDGHRVWWSTWNGAGWSAKALVSDTPGAGWLVAGLASDGLDPTIRLYYVVSSGQIYETHYSSGAWSAAAGDGGTWLTPTLAAGFRPTTAPNGDGNAYLIVANGNPTSLSLKQFNITTGTPGWVAGTTTLQTAGVNSGYSYVYPKFAEARSDSPRQVVCFSQVAPSPIGTQPMIAFTPTPASLQGVVPWRYGGSFGVKVFRDVAGSPSWWVTTSNQVYACAADTASTSTGQRVRFAQNQIANLRLELGKVNRPGRGQVTLLNEGGVLKDAGQAGPHLGVRPWSQVAVTLGYQTGSGAGFAGLPAGAEGVIASPWWVASIAFHDEISSGMPLVTLSLVDGWGLLEQLHFPATVTFTNQTVEYIFDRILWYVSGVVGGTGNSRLSAITLATFTVKAGESLGVVARRLGELAGVVLVFRTIQSSSDGTGFDSVGYAAVNWGAGGSVYSYAIATDGKHPIIQSEVEPMVAPAATSVEVAGAATWSVARNWTPTWLLWRDIVSSKVDKTLGNQTMTDDAASNLASLLAPESQGGSFTSFANVGHELGDQIDVTIATAPISGQVYTIGGLLFTWDWKKGQLIQRLGLAGTN